MLGDFSYCTPTKLYFGEHALEHLPEELKKYGDNVILALLFNFPIVTVSNFFLRKLTSDTPLQFFLMGYEGHCFL